MNACAEPSLAVALLAVAGVLFLLGVFFECLVYFTQKVVK